MSTTLRMQLSSQFYWISSGEATRFDLTAYDWYGMYCGYSI